MPDSGKNNTKTTNTILAVVLFLSFFARYYRFDNRFVLNQDQTRDTIMVMYAIDHHQALLLGSAASAGPFNFGPTYHWLIGLSKLILPLSTAPWLLFTFIACLTPLIFFLITKKLLGLILAIIACLSSLTIQNAPDMLNTILVFYLTSLAFLFLSHYTQKPSTRNLFLVSFFISLATTPHFQSLGLFSITLIFLLSNIKKPKKIIAIITGSLLPYLPNLIFDLSHNFAWTKSVFDYYISGQSRYYYPVRWLTDIFVFWPQLWGQTIGLLPQLGYALIILFFIALILGRQTILKQKFFLIILSSFLFQIILIRYYKGPRSIEYFFTFIAYFIYFTGWSLHQIITKSKLIGYTLLLSLSVLLLFQDYQLITTQTSQAQQILSIKQELETKTGQNQFAFYTESGNNMINLPLFYLLYDQNQIQDDAYKIGTCNQFCPPAEKILVSSAPYTIYDLTNQDLNQYQHLTANKIYNWLYINYQL